MENRYEKNKELLQKLQELIENNKDLRFSQILAVYGFVRETRPISTSSDLYSCVNWTNEFYLESKDLFKRVEKRINDIDNAKKEC